MIAARLYYDQPHSEQSVDDYVGLIGWRGYISEARAAIEAMREPTQAMVDSCGNGECAKWAPGAWSIYIDAALQPTTDTGEAK